VIVVNMAGGFLAAAVTDAVMVQNPLHLVISQFVLGLDPRNAPLDRIRISPPAGILQRLLWILLGPLPGSGFCPFGISGLVVPRLGPDPGCCPLIFRALSRPRVVAGPLAPFLALLTALFALLFRGRVGLPAKTFPLVSPLSLLIGHRFPWPLGRQRITHAVKILDGVHMPKETVVPLTGRVSWLLTGPDGHVKASGEASNVVTQVGDQYYGERAAGIASPPAQVTGMKLGTGSTAVAKTGAGAALVTYLSNSHQALDGSYPASSLASGKRRITWQATWAAGKATSASPITEAVIVNEALADSTSAAAATIARVIVSGVPTKEAGDALTITWTHDLGT
jgi:hypothetical protein